MFFRRSYNALNRYSSPLSLHCYSVFVNAFSTLELPIISLNNNHPSIDESRILSQLNEIFPLSIQNPTNPPKDESIIRSADDFLQPEEKFRGVFLQKLSGKSSVHRALGGVEVVMNIDVLSKVVSRGNLSGDKIITFFNWVMENPNVEKSVSTYNVVIKALGRRNFFSHMIGLFGEMRERGVDPDLGTLTIVIDSYVRARHVSKAVKVFGELERYGFGCDEETLNVVLTCLCRRSQVGAACSLLNKLRGKLKFDSTMYNTIIGGWSKLGRVAEVEKFLIVMVDNGIEPDSFTYSYVIESFGRAGRVEDAVKIFDYVKKEKALTTVVYNAMIFNFIAAGDIDQALKYYDGLLSDSLEPNMDTYFRIIMYFLKIRRVADAIEMFDDMLVRGLIPSAGTVTEFIEPLCKYGPPHAAMMIYNKAKNAGCKISVKAYKLLLMRLSRFGKCGMLQNLWEEMQEKGCTSDVQIYEYIVNGLCNTGKLESAVLVMEESLREGYFPGRIICSKLQNKLMNSNKIEMSYKLFLKLRKARVKENAQTYWRAKGWHF